MSIYYRKESYREKLFCKNLHLKSKVRQVVCVLPESFTFDDFLDAFKLCYSYTWDDIVTYCQRRELDRQRRLNKTLRTLPPCCPELFLKKHISLKNIGNALPEYERQSLKEKLIKNSKEHQAQRTAKLTENLVLVQQVCPPYVQKLIDAYFKTRRKNTLDINARYLILLEASQFKCTETLSFLHKINACEKNIDLRTMAFYALQRLGEHPWFARNRKGRKKLSQLKPIDIKKNPTELLHLLYTHQHLLYQQYDFFLSHSSLDTKELLCLKASLNALGYTIYIDWVNDKEMLNRENQNKDTWPALELRMSQSERMLYVMTDNSIQSLYTKREVEYFKNHKKAVLVYQPHDITLARPDYLTDCNDCALINNELTIKN